MGFSLVTCECGAQCNVRVLPFVCECGRVNRSGVPSDATRVGYVRNPVEIAERKAKQEAASNGPGSHLIAIIDDADRWLSWLRWIPGLNRYSLKACEGCNCHKLAAEMDANGVEWCKENIGSIVCQMSQNAVTCGVPFGEAENAVAYWAVREAIRRATP